VHHGGLFDRHFGHRLLLLEDTGNRGMNQRTAFRRKVIYIAIIALLLIPLYYIGQPATSGAVSSGAAASRIDSSSVDSAGGNTEQASDDDRTNASGGLSSGGKLSQLRAEYRISQASLGEIDPASEAMKLATLGLRGVAANYLWHKAIDYKKVKAWDKVSAATNQITKLQPNYLEVWEFQAHNLAYNISVEFDNYEHRYHWVKKGTEFSMSGTRYNRDEPVMLWNVGWFFGQKLGRADEQVQFRSLFRVDRDFHDIINGYPNIDVDDAKDNFTNQPDNWLVGRLWMLESQRASRRPNASLLGKSPVIFHSAPAMTYINYTSALEAEGFLGDRAQRAWTEAGKYWREYGDTEIPSSWGTSMRLNEMEPALERSREATRKLDELAPGVREQIRQERLDAMTDAERETVGVEEQDLRPDQYGAFGTANAKLVIRNTEVAERAPANERSRAYAWAAKADEAAILAERIGRYRTIVNFEYWRERCNAEKSDAAIAARQYMHDAKEQYRLVQLEKYVDENGVERDGAKELYEKAWVEWKKVFDEFKLLREDIAMSDVRDQVMQYTRVLDALKLEFPEDFPLKDLQDFDPSAQASGAPQIGMERPAAPGVAPELTPPPKPSPPVPTTSPVGGAPSESPPESPPESPLESPPESAQPAPPADEGATPTAEGETSE
jgi:hypothetical protein